MQKRPENSRKNTHFFTQNPQKYKYDIILLNLCAQIWRKYNREKLLLKLVGVKEFYNITRAKIVSAVNCCVVVFVCATATFAVDTVLNTKTVQAQPLETTVETSMLPDQPDTSEPYITESAVVSDTSESSTATSAATSLTTTQTSASSSAFETTESYETTAIETTEETTEATEGTTTAETTEKITEKELFIAVYATTTVNVRSGPGTEYDIVKSVYAGDQIDVVAVTSNGWYKTYNGNYINKDYTTETKPQPSPTSKPTQKQTTETTTTTVEATVTTPSGEGHVCKITFYGPVKMSDGSYSTTTATGTTCKQGRTCGADWSIYPAGTVIYIENDPLGGDGYYTVEDTGPGAKGYHIDIYADDGETGNYSTCNRTVCVV